MPQPAQGTTLPRPDLGIAVEEYKSEKMAGDGYIAERVMLPVNLAKQAATYPVIPIEALLSGQDTKRAMRGYYNRSDYDFESGMYATQENGWEEALDDRERNLYADLFDAELIASKRGMDIVLRAQERRVAAKVQATAGMNTQAATAKWDAHDTADPIGDVAKARIAIRDTCGMLPDTLVLGWKAFENAKRCAKVIEQLKYTFPGEKINSMAPSMLAQVLNVPQILVPGGMFNGAKKGQNAVLSELWNPAIATLTITASGQSISEPCIGRIIRWSEESGSGEGGTIVEEYYTDGNRSNIYRVRHDTDERLIKSYDDAGNVQSDIAKAVTRQLTGVL